MTELDHLKSIMKHSRLDYEGVCKALDQAFDLGRQSYARELGAKGGSKNSPAQVAARKRAKKGAGRPPAEKQETIK